MDIAKYNIEYMTEPAKMTTGFIGALVTAAIEGATVVGIPFAVIAKRFAEALSKVRDIMSMMTDLKLPDRQWPQAVNG
jgi:hypothetical protein